MLQSLWPASSMKIKTTIHALYAIAEEVTRTPVMIESLLIDQLETIFFQWTWSINRKKKKMKKWRWWDNDRTQPVPSLSLPIIYIYIYMVGCLVYLTILQSYSCRAGCHGFSGQSYMGSNCPLNKDLIAQLYTGDGII